MTNLADKQAGRVRRPRDGRYTRVAIFLHWAIAILIILNLIVGFLNWDIAHDFMQRPENRWLYVNVLIFHMSAGMTVLVLTAARVVWRLLHQPPAYPDTMKPWEKRLSHVAHFLLYAAMVLMPLTGWMILSANPPLGSEGATAKAAQMAAANPAPAASAPTAPKAPPRKRPELWWGLGPLPAIDVLEDVGETKEGVKAQHVMHEVFVDWHAAGAWMMLFLLLLHLAGALKHQWLDRELTLQRMGWGRFPDEKREQA